MKKRLAAIFLAAVMILSAVPVCAAETNAAPKTDINDPAVYYTPNSDYRSGDCILTATKMMLRRACIMRDREWSNITNESLRGWATVAGLLKWSFTADVNGVAFKIGHGTFKGMDDKKRVAQIAELLKDHPEGIVVHGSHTIKSGMHGVLAVKVVNGVIYAADSTRNKGSVNDGIQPWSKTTMINKPSRVTSYWYIIKDSPGQTVNGSVNGTQKSKLRIISYRVPSEIKAGSGYSIRGIVKSNKKLKKVTVRIVDEKGVIKIKASKKVKKKKSFNLRKLDAKVRFGTLAPGNYKYQVIAKDTKQSVKLINQPFAVKAAEKKES